MMPFRVYELAYSKHEQEVQQIEKGWFDNDEEDPESQAAKEFRENQEHHQMSQAWKDELAKSLSRCCLNEQDQPQEGDEEEVEEEIESEEEQPPRRNTKTKGYARSYAVTEKWFKAMVATAATVVTEAEARGDMVVTKKANIERGVANWWPENHGNWNQYLMLILGVLAVIGIVQICRWIREFLCEKRCGTKGCCKKRESTVEKVEEGIEPFDLRGTVYITGGGNCFHRYSNCHSLKFAKIQKREPCSFCEREFAKVQETAAFLMKHRAEKDKELESRMAHMERKQD